VAPFTFSVACPGLGVKVNPYSGVCKAEGVNVVAWDVCDSCMSIS
jgi:hypothetical protein